MSARNMALFILVAAVILIQIGSDNRMSGQSAPADQGVRTPLYHASPPPGPLPAIMSPAKFQDNVTRNAYLVAGKIPEVLYQQPCYCYCDRSHGHKSLHDCFTSGHAATCNVCQREAFYANEQHKQGKTPSAIRKGITNADWADIDISRYEKKLRSK